MENLEEMSGGNQKQWLAHGDMNSKLLYTMSRMQRKHNVRRKQEVFSCKRRGTHTATMKYIGILTSKGWHSTLFLVLRWIKLHKKQNLAVSTKTNPLSL